jgi:hypothetical protein
VQVPVWVLGQGRVPELVREQVLAQEQVRVPHNRQAQPRLIPVLTELTKLYFSPIFLLLLKIQFVSVDF